MSRVCIAGYTGSPGIKSADLACGRHLRFAAHQQDRALAGGHQSESAVAVDAWAILYATRRCRVTALCLVDSGVASNGTNAARQR
jgi:hypothetical protein